jgi:hypothetical protein
MTTHSGLALASQHLWRTTDRIRPLLRGRRALVAIGLLAVAAVLAWQRNWLTAIGIAPVLVSLAPCAAMCAMGICMAGSSGRPCRAGDESRTVSPAASGQMPERATEPTMTQA